MKTARALYPYQPGEAVTHMLDALEVIEEEEREVVSKEIMSEVLNAVTELGSYDAAIAVCKRVLALWLKHGRQPNVNKLFLTITILQLAKGDVPAADTAFQEHIQNDEYLASRECAAEEELVAACRNFDESGLEEAKKAHVVQYLDAAVRRLATKLVIGEAVPPLVEEDAYNSAALVEEDAYNSAVAGLPIATVGARVAAASRAAAASKAATAPTSGAGAAAAPTRRAAAAPAASTTGAKGSLTSARAALFAPTGTDAPSPAPPRPSPAPAPAAPPAPAPRAASAAGAEAAASAGADDVAGAQGEDEVKAESGGAASAVLSEDEIAARIAAAKALESGDHDDEEEDDGELGML
eukprot:CAMPEP_0196797256 /NCGR_PEP_ID=MMETSP1104-20130614/38549_1 /TAXON_ID=33652 /ORGANISM="Cafeteria sp., Strain Caron Lab Isolate" /LENGTH=352 /DNA_ID=CAMNT_0042167661 /DNA_START=102 /DNA_END=1160 /DNA_ORIENTATION=+